MAARLLAALAAAINDSRAHDSARAGYNLCLLFSALFIAGLTHPLLVWRGPSPPPRPRPGHANSAAVWSLGGVACSHRGRTLPPARRRGLLGELTRTLGELDVALTLSILRRARPPQRPACAPTRAPLRVFFASLPRRTAGFKLRSEDPAGLRDFIVKLQERSAQAQQQGAGGAAAGKAKGAQAPPAAAPTAAAAAGAEQGLSTRARLLLELVCDLKNGKKGGKLGGGAAGDGGAEFPPALVKWVRESGVGEVHVALRSLTWDRLLDSASHRGHWWLPEAAGTEEWEGRRLEERQRAAAEASRQGAELLRAAAALRMNTASRKAVFCAVMGADDFVDAFERVVKLGLPEAQDRETLRVVLECLCQEKAYNPFYEHLAARLCGHAKRHRVTLQFALWDQWKELPGADVRRISHLARFAAALIGAHLPRPLRPSRACRDTTRRGRARPPRPNLSRRMPPSLRSPWRSRRVPLGVVPEGGGQPCQPERHGPEGAPPLQAAPQGAPEARGGTGRGCSHELHALVVGSSGGSVRLRLRCARSPQELLTRPQLNSMVTAFRRARPASLRGGVSGRRFARHPPTRALAAFYRRDGAARRPLLRRRVAGKSELAPLRAKLLLFITDHVLKGADPSEASGPGAELLARAKAAENALQGEALIEERMGPR